MGTSPKPSDRLAFWVRRTIDSGADRYLFASYFWPEWEDRISIEGHALVWTPKGTSIVSLAVDEVHLSNHGFPLLASGGVTSLPSPPFLVWFDAPELSVWSGVITTNQEIDCRERDATGGCPWDLFHGAGWLGVITRRGTAKYDLLAFSKHGPVELGERIFRAELEEHVCDIVSSRPMGPTQRFLPN